MKQARQGPRHLEVGNVVEEDLHVDPLTCNVDSAGKLQDADLLAFLGSQLSANDQGAAAIGKSKPQLTNNGTTRIVWTESLQSGELLPVARRLTGGAGGGRKKGSRANDDDDEEDRLLQGGEEGGEDGAQGGDDADVLAERYAMQLFSAPSFVEFRPDGTFDEKPQNLIMKRINLAQRWAYLGSDAVAIICSCLPTLFEFISGSTKLKADNDTYGVYCIVGITSAFYF